PLAHVGGIDRLKGRRHVGEHVAFPHTRAETGKVSRRRRASSSRARLHDSAGIWVRDDAPGKLYRAPSDRWLRNPRPHRKEALRTLRHEDRAVRQHPCDVSGPGRLMSLWRIMIHTFVRERSKRKERKKRGSSQHRGCATAPGEKHTHQSTQNERRQRGK